MERLVRYPWPGNIYELQNVIERVVVLAPGAILTSDYVFIQVPTQGPGSRGLGAGVIAEREEQGMNRLQDSGFEETLALEDVEKRHILAVLKQTAGVIEGAKGTAQILDLHPNTLRSRMKKLGIKRASRE